MDDGAPTAIDLRAEYEDSGVREVLDEPDRELIGLVPVKQRIRETAALLLVDRTRARLRQANRLFSQDRPVTAAELCTITAPDIRASRVLSGGLDPDGSRRRRTPHEQ